MKCLHCGNQAHDMHHIHPRSRGGNDTDSNLVPLCKACHRKHHSKHGHFEEWGRRGGLVTAASMKSFANLKQFKTDAGKQRLEEMQDEYRKNSAFYALIKSGLY